jgi:hypothetical protein
MNTLTSHSVVDRMTADLAERRHMKMHRRAAYVALARAILNDDRVEMPVEPAFEWNSTLIAQAA